MHLFLGNFNSMDWPVSCFTIIPLANVFICAAHSSFFSHDTKKCGIHVYTCLWATAQAKEVRGLAYNILVKWLQTLVNRMFAIQLEGKTTIHGGYVTNPTSLSLERDACTKKKKQCNPPKPILKLATQAYTIPLMLSHVHKLESWDGH